MAYTRGIASGQTFSEASGRKNPYQKFNFLVDIDSFAKAGFKTVTGLEKKVNVVEYRDGGDNNSKRKEPGWTDYPNITLSRGMSDDKDLITWANESMNLDGVKKTSTQAKRDMTITLQDARQEPVRRWQVYDAFVVSYKFDDLDADSDDFLIENVEIAHEGWEEIAITPAATG